MKKNEKEKKPKKQRISTKMLAIILPVIILSMAVLAFISANSSRAIIEKQIAEQVDAELQAQLNNTAKELSKVERSAMDLSSVIGLTYKDLDIKTYEAMFQEIVSANDMVMGSGVWFEPYAYDSTKEYVGPYVFKSGDKIDVTYDYETKEYDYPSQAYYTMVANGEKKAKFTDPYYDATTQSVMTTCAMPIYSASNQFLGCVTVDINLNQIQDVINAIQIGENGTASLLTGNGVYISSPDSTKTENETNITAEANATLAAAGQEILANDKGTVTYKAENGIHNLYYDTLTDIGWTLIIDIPLSQLNQPVNELLMKLLVVCVFAVICSTIAVLIVVTNISKSLKKVQIFAGLLADGDFTIQPLESKSKDELGQMSESLDNMYASNKEVIQNISNQSKTINEASVNLNRSSDELLREFEQIEAYMSKVNEAMMTSSAATEEVNASVEEVSSSVNLLAEETVKSKNLVNEIRNRADDIEDKSQESFHYATKLSGEFQESLGKSIENAKVVESIGEMASVISNIAEQINLLSLNASIEAARAGEQGRGFAVVASEIGKLAGDTSKAVDEIQSTIADVHNAFNGLTEESKSLLEFLTGTVTPDYDKFVGVARQYGQDAGSIEELTDKISIMSENIERIMSEVSSAVQSIAESAQDTADNSGKTLEAVGEVSKVVDDVSSMSKEQQEIAEELHSVVGKFKL